jgi:uncharacterized membrane protein
MKRNTNKQKMKGKESSAITGRRSKRNTKQNQSGVQEQRQRNNSANGSSLRLAKGLGLFSLGLGFAELLAPRGVAKVAGLNTNRTGLIRLFGLREIASGLGIFMQRKPTEAVWSRVAGDALDVACLGVAFNSSGSKKGRLAFATANVLGVTALDIVCAKQLTTANGEALDVKEVTRSVVINASPQELYSYWRDFEKLPTFMKHLESVRLTGERQSHWVAKAPAGTTVEWDAEITADEPNRRIAWRSTENSDVYNSGSITFEPAPGDRGTIVKVEMQYEPPAGTLGVALAKLFGEEPDQQVSEDLRRFKQVIETGEVVVSDATIEGIAYSEQLPARASARETADTTQKRKTRAASAH